MICDECGNDLVAEGESKCLDCLEFANMDLSKTFGEVTTNDIS